MILEENCDNSPGYGIPVNKICFITAIYGNYEASCKKFVEQSIKTDFICFTDNINIETLSRSDS